jgi:UDP-N-acetylmuramyl pentapeptide phosphotransferase/UDP-N-acetylglucosamine-1-phosphate transferase
MRKEADNLVSAQANLSALVALRLSAAEPRGRSQNPAVVRFWIITMMLVMVGLSTLKLR